jgi:hypothetical protein
MCGQLKRDSVAVWEKGEFVLAVQEIVGVDIPRIAASVVFLVLCLVCYICIVEYKEQHVTCIVEVNKLKRSLTFTGQKLHCCNAGKGLMPKKSGRQWT